MAVSLLSQLNEKARSEIKVSVNTSVDGLLEQIRQCNGQVPTDVSFRRPHRALVEHVKAGEMLRMLSVHHEFPYLRPDRKERYLFLRKEHEAQNAMMQAIKDSIQRPIASPVDSSRPRSRPASRKSSVSSSASRPTSALSESSTPRNNPFRPLSSNYARGSLMKPSDELHLNFGSSNGSRAPLPSSSDPLVARFAQLRTSPGTAREASVYASAETQSPSSSRPQSRQRSFYQDAPHSPLGARPQGPRLLRQYSANGPLPPPKMPLDGREQHSPLQAPSPVYSPARSVFEVDEANESAGSDRESSGSPREPRSRIPYRSTRITAAELYEAFQSLDILIIDVRPRDYFDEGHILTKSVVCIEPLSLTYGIAFEELLEKMIYAPDIELQMLDRIAEYDLVVYMDQRTNSDRFLKGPPGASIAPSLRALHDSLSEFNYTSPLRRPPALLLGGVDAWVDLMGVQSLATSTTHVVPRAQLLAKPSRRPTHRVSLTGNNSSREIRRRRLRDLTPLNADEEREWLAQARSEEVKPTELGQFQVESEGNAAEDATNDSASPAVHNLEDFFRKFPEPAAIPASMISAQPDPPASTRYSLGLTRPAPAASRPSYSGVSEKAVQQSAATRSITVAPPPPLYTSRYLSSTVKLPRTGLINFGVTCYMSATVQCLSATIPLSLFFLGESWREYIQKNWKGSNGVFPEIFANLIRGLWLGAQAALRPVSLRKLCTRLNPEWGIERQQDAKEFFDFMVDCLHEDLNERWNRHPLAPLSAQAERNRELAPINQVTHIEWERYSHREYSFVSNLFAGQHLSRLRCTTCNHTSTTYEAFYSISVEIPRSGASTVADCLRSYCQEELLSGDEEWRCPHCRCSRQASKQIRITRLPQILVIHLKRFSASKTERARKVHTPIEFPLYGLDMEPYTVDTRLPAKPGEESRANPATTPPFRYDAYGVMRHIGSTSNGGHYVALVRDAARGVWRKFDDDRVSDFDPARLKSQDRLQNEQAYIIFFERARAR